MKKILITGMNSYIGTSFEKYIKEKFPREYIIDSIDMIDGAWRNKDFSRYDSVFHVAGIAHQKETKKNAMLYYNVNRDLTIETAKKAKEDGVKQFVFLSSMSVYGMNTGVITKDTELCPKSNYGKSKLEAEKLITELVDDTFVVSIIRPPMVYGHGCRGNYNTLASIALKSPIFPKINNQRSMLYIDNLCEFVRLVISECKYGVFHPQNTEYVNTTQMVKLICQVNRKRARTTIVMNWMVLMAKMFIPAFKKAFGSLIYDMQMSEYKEKYNLVDFFESIEKTELNQDFD